MKKIKYLFMLMIFGLLFTTTGCSTSSFCNAKDVESIRTAYAEKITIVVVDYYESKNEVIVSTDFSFVEDEAKALEFEAQLIEDEILSSTNLNKEFRKEGFEEKFKKVHEEISDFYNNQEVDSSVEKYVNTYVRMTKGLTDEQGNEVIKGHYKFMYKNSETGKWKTPETPYASAQKDLWNANPQACLTNKEFEDVSGGKIEAKTWGDAWSEGLLEGLFVYPISWLLHIFTNLIGNTGVGQVVAIFVTTVLVRLLTVGFTIKSTIQSQRMQEMQPEMQKIQAKYATKQNDPIAKQKMSQEMMKLYQKNNINPITSLITPFLSMPIFFAMWGAVSRTSIIRTGSLFGLNMSTTLNVGIFDGNIFAIILFLFMIAGQFVSMKLPQWMAKRKANKKVRLEDPRANSVPNSGKWVTNIFLFMIIFMGFMLPAAMTVYWIAGSVFSVAQTLLISRFTEKKKENK